MKSGLDFIGMIVDRSGSMGGLINDTITGYNTFIEDQKNQPREAVTLLALFDNNIQIFEIENIKNCKLMRKGDNRSSYTYNPSNINLNGGVVTATAVPTSTPDETTIPYTISGSTALLDAIGKTINHIGNYLKNLDESERPEKVIIGIITDGEENASTEFSHTKIKEMISHQQDIYNWKFIFMGANIDSFSVAGGLGISKNMTMNYAPTGKGVHMAYCSSSFATSNLRGMAAGSNDVINLSDIANSIESNSNV